MIRGGYVWFQKLLENEKEENIEKSGSKKCRKTKIHFNPTNYFYTSNSFNLF